MVEEHSINETSIHECLSIKWVLGPPNVPCIICSDPSLNRGAARPMRGDAVQSRERGIWITACARAFPALRAFALAQPPPCPLSLLLFLYLCSPSSSVVLHASSIPLDNRPHLLVCQCSPSTMGLLRISNSTASSPVVPLPLPPCPLLLSPPSALCHTGLFCQ